MAATAPTPSEGTPSLNGSKDLDEASPVFEDSRSETSTVDSESEARSGASCPSDPESLGLTFFTRLYEIPVISDAVTRIRRIAESNRYTSSIISYAEKVGGGLAERSGILKPVERPIMMLDGLATRSLDLIESRYPIVARPTDEIVDEMQAQAHNVEARYPVVARTFAVAKSTANSTLDRVDYLIDYVLPPTEGDQPAEGTQQPADDSGVEGSSSGAEGAKEQGSESPLGKLTILVYKVPQRLGEHYRQQLEASKAAIGGIQQTVKDTATIYESEIGERSSRLLGSVQERLSSAVNTTIPQYLPQFVRPYYDHGKEVLVTKAARLHAEYSRTDQDTRAKVFGLILISGEQVPVLENITSRIFIKGTGASPAEYSQDTQQAAAQEPSSPSAAEK
ncbi:hypothetical protein GGF46_004337 [Coemansia sp. RSA 552]|nr:hypothetical protein GGF46_004337 [Coemansia sp. RSA 552]